MIFSIKRGEDKIFMKIAAILGSPHINGNGASALQAILSGATSVGAECQLYVLSKYQIKNCLGCRTCIKNGGNCVLKDDFSEIFESIKSADFVIIESPIYINQVNGLVKTFLDRCYPLADENHKPRFGKRKIMLLCTYAVPIPFIFSRYIHYTGKSLKAMGLEQCKYTIIHGCTTIDHVQKNKKLLDKLYKKGRKLGTD